MTAFRFRLETLLRLRRAALDEQRARLSEAYRAEAIVLERIHDVQRQMDENARHRRTAAAAGAVNVDAAMWAQRFDLILQAQFRELARQREAVAAAIEDRRRSVIEADRGVKVLERLRERRLDEYRESEQRQEAKHLDEVASRQREAP